MSRIGILPIAIPEKIDIKLEEGKITVKGPKGELSTTFDPRFKVVKEEKQLTVERPSDSKQDRSLHGSIRSIISNLVTGVVDGYEKKLMMVGIGYTAKVKGKELELEVGYSHPVTIPAEDNIEYEVASGNVDNQRATIITIKGIDKQQIGELAAKIREVRGPEPYKGKGIRYENEHIRRKVGKTG